MNDYHHWSQRLKGIDMPIIEDQPQPGFYEMRDGSKNGPRVPVAIFWRGDELIARLPDRVEDPLKVWLWCAKTPIESEIAKQVFATGKWPDMPEPTRAELGHNQPDDPFEALEAEASDKIEQIEDWLKDHPRGATSQLEADMARNMEAQAHEFVKRINEMRETEKRPHLEAGRAVDAKFKPLSSCLSVAKQRLKEAWGVFAVAEENRRREAHKRAVEADPEQAETTAPKKVNVGGGVGNRGGLTTTYDWHIEDVRQALGHFADHPQIVAELGKVVARAVKASKGSIKIPGVTIEIKRAPK